MKHNMTQKGIGKTARKIGCFDWQVDEPVNIIIQTLPVRQALHAGNDSDVVAFLSNFCAEDFLLLH